MIRMPISELSPGLRIARSLHYEYGGIMLRPGARLDDVTISKLRQFGVDSIYVEDGDTADIEAYDLLDEEQRQRITRRLRGVYDGLRDEVRRSVPAEQARAQSRDELVRHVQSDRVKSCAERLNLREPLQAIVDAILENLRPESELANCLSILKGIHSYLFDHSIEVAVYASLLGRRLGLSRTELEELALGCLVHDFGYVFLPEDVLTKNGPLTAEESRLLEAHATLGYHFLKENRTISLLSAHVAYQHHEKIDGSGYPRHLRGPQMLPRRGDTSVLGPGIIHRYALIAAVPNAFDSWTTPRPYGPAISREAAYQRILEEAGAGFHTEVVELFAQMIPVYPVGAMVELREGPYKKHRAVVTRVPSEDPSRPAVRILYDAHGRRMTQPVELETLKQPVPLKLLTG